MYVSPARSADSSSRRRWYSASARLRARYIRRTNSSSLTPDGRVTSSCSIAGSSRSAQRPSTVGSVGTTRQPITVRPERSTADSRICRPRTAASLSNGRNTIARPRSSSLVPACPRRSRSSCKIAYGMPIVTPAPSPVSGSALTAPRWVRLTTPCTACSTNSCVATPSSRAMNPVPQASRKLLGS